MRFLLAHTSCHTYCPSTQEYPTTPTPATALECYPGDQVSAPINFTRFPENNAHLLVAFGYAEFPVNDANKSIVDDLKPGAIKAKIANGRPLVDTGLPSENPVLILKDILRDPVFGLGLPNSAFDATAITAAANYVGTRYQVLYNFKQPVGLTELVQRILGDCHCYITFEGGKIQINAKRNNETSIDTFATCDSGVAGRKVEDDYADASIKDSSELVNEFSRQFRVKNHPRRWITLSDTNAQTRAGGTAKKVVSDGAEEWDGGGPYDETQNQILAAIALREEQNGNLFPSYSSPFWDALDIMPGEVYALRTVDVINNAVNKDNRIVKKTIDVENGKIGFETQTYKAAIYNDDAIALGVDLLRAGLDSVIPGRPPDVTPVSLALVALVNDTEGRLATIRATFTVPAFDPTVEQADGLFREPPIAKVEIWHSWADESVMTARYGKELIIKQAATSFNASIDFDLDYHKGRSVVAYFVTVAPNGARSPLGIIPDSTKVMVLSAPGMTATGATATVPSTAVATAGDYAIAEREILQIASKTGTVLTFLNSSGIRTPLFNSISIAHPTGTEIAIGKVSYPGLALSLNTPRFNYPTVTGVAIRARGDSVNVKWADIAAENTEDYGAAYSTDADAGTNIAKLGSANPAWYAADPLSPPASVKIIWTKSLHKHILQEDLGGAGVVAFVRVFARNNKRNYSGALSALVSGNSVGTVMPDTAAPTPAGAPAVHPRQQKIKVKCPQPSAQVNFFLKNEIVARVKTAGGTILGYVQDAAGAPANSATEFKNNIERDWNHTFHWKKSQIVALYPTGATIEFYNYLTNEVNTGSASAVTSLNIASWEVDSVATDSAAPTLATPSAPTVGEYFGEIKCSAPLPVANINTLDTFQFVLSTQNTAPAGNPTIGSEGVQSILYGQFCSFNRNLASTAPLYVYYRAHNQVNYSSWSSGTSQANFSRPLQDMIGNSVPVLPEKLEINGNSGSGHTSTTFVLDSGASAVDDFYNGMVLHLPASGNADRVLTILDYVGSTRTCTVSPSFSSTPSGSVAYEIHRIEISGDRGGRSGTGHSSTTFVLDSGASAVDDFYNGFTILVPALGSGRIRKVIDYVGATRTCTVESAFGSTPSGNHGFMLINGSFGFASADLTGIISPAPFRLWLDGDNDVNVAETLTPVGGNAFSLSDIEYQYWKSNGTPEFKKSYLLKVATGITLDSLPAPVSSSARRSIRVRLRNLFREGGSDGWSTFSCYVEVDHSTTSTTPGVPNYAPGTFTPKLIDFQGEDSYPGGRYNYA